MCNHIKPKSSYTISNKIKPKSIPKEGIGYKLFLKSRWYQNQEELWTLFLGGDVTKMVWMKWKMIYKTGDGFTFFKDKRQAIAMKKYYLRRNPTDAQEVVIYKIQYKGGLIERFEADPAVNRRMALCKEYITLEEIKDGTDEKENNNADS